MIFIYNIILKKKNIVLKMKFIHDKYYDFLNEAYKYEIKRGQIYRCDANFKGIKNAKNKYVEIINIVYGYPTRYTLKFLDNIITIKDENGERETDTIRITENQIKGLVLINRTDYERIKQGFTLRYNASENFDFILRQVNFRNRYKYYDISYFDIDKEKNDVVSFLPSSKVESALKDGSDPYESKYRQTSKIGRLLQKLDDKITSSQLESFVYTFKAYWDILKKDYSANIEVVTGDKIVYWYNEKRYLDDGGTLNSSCMRGEDKEHRIKFYALFPDKIALCILKDNKNKLLARALIWRLDEPENVVFMDRIYYVRPQHEIILKRYAETHNIQTKLSGYNLKNKLSIYLDLEKYKNINLPYLDTMRFHKNGIFSNK